MTLKSQKSLAQRGQVINADAERWHHLWKNAGKKAFDSD